MKKALITGINGQDGSYLAELLLDKGYEVHGILRRHSNPEHQSNRIDHLIGDINTEYGDVTDGPALFNTISRIKPDEIYNLAAQSHVRVSFDIPTYTANSIITGTLNILESVRGIGSNIKIYQASSSEMFGNSIDDDGYQRETTPMIPVSPYGCAKLAAYNLCNVYKDSYDMFISNGILFNHESPRRGITFVTAKIVKGAVAISKGLEKDLALGNLDACRDWGHAKDYVKGIWQILQTDKPGNYVCATGVSSSVRDVCEYVFRKLHMDYREYIIIDPKYYRPLELDSLKGDSTKFRKEVGWAPSHTLETTLDDIINHYLKK